MNTTELIAVHDIDKIRTLIGELHFRSVVEGALNRKAVRLDADGDRIIESYWDYRDVDSLREHAVRLLCEMDDEFEKPEDVRNAILAAIEEKAFGEDWFGEVERVSYQEIIDDFSNILEKSFNLDTSGIDYSDWREYLECDWNIVFDNGIAAHLDDFELNVNIMFNIGEEWNYEHTSISTSTSLLNDLLENGVEEGEEAFSADDMELISENSLTWLVYSQGYTLSDVFFSDKKSPFLNSVRQELVNLVSYIAKLTCLTKIDLNTYCQLRAKEGGNFTIDPKQCKGYEFFTMGLVDDFNGGGSVLGIELEKPVAFNGSLVNALQIESNAWNNGYTVDSIYGLVGSAWSRCIAPTNEPVLGIPDVDFNQLETDAIARRNEWLREEETGTIEKMAENGKEATGEYETPTVREKELEHEK